MRIYFGAVQKLSESVLKGILFQKYREMLLEGGLGEDLVETLRYW